METRLIRLGLGEEIAWEWSGLVADPPPEVGGELEGGETVTLEQLGIRLAVVEVSGGEVVLRVETPLADVRVCRPQTNVPS
jgi:hypothetical protein